MIFLTLLIFLMPPSVREVYDNEIQKILLDNGRIEFMLPNGYGINNIRIIVSPELEKEAEKKAKEIINDLHIWCSPEDAKAVSDRAVRKYFYDILDKNYFDCIKRSN